MLICACAMAHACRQPQHRHPQHSCRNLQQNRDEANSKHPEVCTTRTPTSAMTASRAAIFSCSSAFFPASYTIHVCDASRFGPFISTGWDGRLHSCTSRHATRANKRPVAEVKADMRTRWVGGARGGAVRIDLDCRELLLQLGEVELFREDRGRHRRPTSPQGMEVLQISCRRHFRLAACPHLAP